MLFRFLKWIAASTLLLLAVEVRSQSTQRRCGQQRIANARSATPWPWMVAITRKSAGEEHYRPRCSGFMIDRLHVVTGAWCFEERNLYNYKIHIGNVDFSRAPEYPIASIVAHTGYRTLNFDNDIAIVMLGKPVAEPGFNPVCLPDDEIRRLNLDNERATVAGWGQRQKTSTTPLKEWNTILQQLRGMPIVSNQDCDRSYRDSFKDVIMGIMFPRGINSKMVCAGFPEGGKTACGAAKGGPLMIQKDNKWYAVGVASFVSCRFSRVPSGFTRVSEYLEWIWENTWI